MRAVVTGAVLVLASPSHADPDARTAIALRYELPAPLHVGVDHGHNMLGGALAARFLERYEIDVGMNLSSIDDRAVLLVHARGGLSPRLARGSDWSLRLPLLAGVIRAHTMGGGSFSLRMSSTILAITTGLEATRWMGSVGLQVRAVAYAGPQFGSYHDGRGDMERVDRLTYGASLSAGVSVGW